MKLKQHVKFRTISCITNVRMMDDVKYRRSAVARRFNFDAATAHFVPLKRSCRRNRKTEEKRSVKDNGTG